VPAWADISAALKKNAALYAAHNDARRLQVRLDGLQAGHPEPARTALLAELPALLATATVDGRHAQLARARAVHTTLRDEILPAQKEADAMDLLAATALAARSEADVCRAAVATQAEQLRTGVGGDAAARDAAWSGWLAAQRHHAELLQQQHVQQGQRAQRHARLVHAAARSAAEETLGTEEGEEGGEQVDGGDGCGHVDGLVAEGAALMATVRDTLQPLRAASQRAMQALRDCLRAEQVREEELVAAIAGLEKRARACVTVCVDALQGETPAQDAAATLLQQQVAEAELRRLEDVDATCRKVG